jgi:RNA polymerase sigma-70 factor, ECF subfamily
VVPSNSDLLKAARRHVPDAWDTLLKQHQLPLYTYVAELLGDRTAALDVVQETFAAAVRYIDTLRTDERFGSWLFGIAHQKCVQQWRRVRRTSELFATPADDNETIADWPDNDGVDPRTALVRSEQAGEFFALLEQLSAAQRAALLLHVIEDFSLEEIARITDVPVGTVKSRLHHAKRALRQLVEALP